MDLIKIKTFNTVARLGSFTRAAEVLHLSQPAVSQQIRELEHEYRTPFFERIGRSIKLTAAGLVLLPYAEAVLKYAQESKDAVNRICHSNEGRIRVGVTTLTGVYVLPEIIAEFRASFPEIAIDITLDYAAHIREKILANEIDIGVIGGNQAACREVSLLEQVLLRDEIVVVIAANHRWAERRSIRRQELTEEKLILAPRTTLTRQIVERNTRKKGLHLNVEYETASHSLIKRMVENGLGITLLCHSEVRRECQAGWLKSLRLSDLHMPRTFVMVFHRDKPVSPAQSTFMDFLTDQREHFQTLFVGDTCDDRDARLAMRSHQPSTKETSRSGS